jgi:NAD(P)-dependent dehydrogenase (short-subunit alcohol dehydrogenase family)
MNFESVVALVTGASRSIGAAIAERLASEGDNVAVGYESDRDAASQVVDAHFARRLKHQRPPGRLRSSFTRTTE